MSTIGKISGKLETKTTPAVPEVASFREFLIEFARVKVTGGNYIPYSFEGREALIPIVEVLDHVLGSHTGIPLPDATVDICGGAQFGKTILALNFGAYLTACRFLNWGYYLPDDKLVEGVVDTKLRPDVIEQIDFLGPLMELDKSVDKRGRRVNRKGAFMVSDGTRKAFGMIMGLGKIPTTFSMDAAMEDEKDDIPQKNSDYLEGRMTAGDLRLRSSIGTQRLHGAGQNKQWQDGSQGVSLFEVGKDGQSKRINLEENWPGVCRLALGGTPNPCDPKLTLTGDFEDKDGHRYPFKQGAAFYLADPETGVPVDRRKPIEHHRKPERIEDRAWSFRISQLAIAAIDLNQIVKRWQEAVRKPNKMVVFCCDVLALPKNTTQGLSPEILKRSRTSGEPFDMVLAPAKVPSYAGMDTGNTCWWYSRSVHSEREKRCQWAEEIALGDMVRRGEVLFRKLGITALFIDSRPAVAEAQELCYRLNGLSGIKWPKVAKPDESVIRFGTGPTALKWDGKKGRWENLRCAVVEFTRKEGAGMAQKIGKASKDGVIRFYPIIQVNRFESIDRVILEFHTPDEGLVQLDADDELVEEPVMRLPRLGEGAPPILAKLDSHLITGSARVEEGDQKGDYVDQCDNHLLLADAYSSIAEEVAAATAPPEPVEYEAVENEGRNRGRRSL